MGYKTIVIGVSSGGVEALQRVLKDLDDKLKIPIIIVIHISGDVKGLVDICSNITKTQIKEAEDKEIISDNGCIYFAPAGYHLSVEDDCTFSLSVEEKVNLSRPSIDVLFESAAEVYGKGLVGIILTGANKDGAMGLKRVEELGGVCVVQAPKEAFMNTMPLAAIREVRSAKVMKLSQINKFIKQGMIL